MGESSEMIPVSVHEKNLREMRCVVTEMYPVTLHHTHGGSMLNLGKEFRNPGMAERNNPFLQIPLMLEYHTGVRGIDGSIGVESWEALYGTQVEFLYEVNENLEYSIWVQAILWSKENWKSANPVESHLS